MVGIAPPIMAIYFGRLFNAFSEFLASRISADTLGAQIHQAIYPLLAVACGMFLSKIGQFSLWVIFGELQAQKIRTMLFDDMLRKNQEWYNTRSTGVASLLTQLQT
jgi:ATP-binding cassette subfamily B (MDR/TAP) protein 1